MRKSGVGLVMLSGFLALHCMAAEPSAIRDINPPGTDDTGGAATINADPHVGKAIEFMNVSGSRELVDQRIDLLLPLVMQLVRQAAKSQDPAFMVEIEKTTKEELKKSEDSLLLAEAKIYAAHFTDSELDALIAFYKSDVGKRYLSERPKIVQESVVVGQMWGKAIGADVVKRVLEKMGRRDKDKSL